MKQKTQEELEKTRQRRKESIAFVCGIIIGMLAMYFLMI